MKKLLPILAVLLCGCATTPTNWQSQLAPDSLTHQTVVAVAKHYGDQKAAELASAGLSATAEVLQGYVNKEPPIDIITKSPGVEGVGHIMVNWLKDKNVITQKTVDNIHKMAALATRITYSQTPKTVADNK